MNSIHEEWKQGNATAQALVHQAAELRLVGERPITKTRTGILIGAACVATSPEPEAISGPFRRSWLARLFRRGGK